MVQANETSRATLLERDVYILFEENARLKQEIATLKMDNAILRNENSTFSRRIGMLVKKLDERNKVETAEEESPEEIAYFIEQQRLAMGLDYEQMGALFNKKASTVKAYTQGKSITQARRFANKIIEYRRRKRP
jgi:regulator of replication initiation timing